MPLSNYAKNKLMGALLDEGAFISLHSGDPGGLGMDEIVGQSYSRQKIKSFSSDMAGERKSNEGAIFKELPSVTVTHIGVWDAETGGNLLWSAELLSKKDIQEGDALELSAGNIILGLS